MYAVLLKNLQDEDERITLGVVNTKEGAQKLRKTWRTLLGRNWTVDRRPDVDTLDNLALVIEKYEEPE